MDTRNNKTTIGLLVECLRDFPRDMKIAQWEMTVFIKEICYELQMTSDNRFVIRLDRLIEWLDRLPQKLPVEFSIIMNCKPEFPHTIIFN